MKALTLKNFIIAFVGTSSLIAIGTVRDLKNKSVAELDEDFADDVIVEADRNLASEVQTRGAKALYLALNEINSQRINGEWEIVRHVKDNKPQLDASHGDRTLKVNFRLISTSTIKVGSDADQLFQVSILEGNKIALFKKLNGGYEILEARKLVREVASEENGVMEMILANATLAKFPGQNFKGNNVEGSLTLIGKELQSVEVRVSDDKGVDYRISINVATLGDAGAFTADVDGQDVSGMFYNNGQDGYRMTFINGPLQGSQLDFMNEEQARKKAEIEEESSREQSFEQKEAEVKEEEQKQEEPKVVSEQNMEEKFIEDSANRNAQTANENDVYTQEEAKEIGEKQGFAF